MSLRITRKKIISIVVVCFAIGVICLTFAFNNNAIVANAADNSLGRWYFYYSYSDYGYSDNKLDRDTLKNMEFLKDGTGIVDGAAITWKTENDRFYIMNPWGAEAWSYFVWKDNKILTLIKDDGTQLSYMSEAEKKAQEFNELCRKGSLQQIVDAIKNGADVKAMTTNNSGETPLFALNNTNESGAEINPEVITTLIKAGVDVNVKNLDGMTPLMRAMRCSIMSKSSLGTLITTLIKAGADVNAKDYDGKTPLILAAIQFIDIIPILLEYGADPKAKDNSGKMAIDYARGYILEDPDKIKKRKQLEEASR